MKPIINFKFKEVLKMKKYIKNFTAALISAAILSAICGCSAEKPQSEGLDIITTNFPPYDFVRQISGGDITPTMLLSGGQDSHSYEPTAREMVQLSEADILICTGGESDAWVDSLTESAESLKIVRMMDFVEPVEAEHDEDDHEKEEHDHVHDELDEHVWTSPKNAILISNGIAEALCEADPENAEKYRAGLETYTAELTELDRGLTEAAGKLEKPLIFGDRFPFRYMARDYGIEYYAAFSGCSSEAEPSAARLASLIETAKSENVGVIYYIEFSTQKVADTIAEAAGAKTQLMHSCHTLSDADLAAGETYISIMRRNIAAMAGE